MNRLARTAVFAGLGVGAVAVSRMIRKLPATRSLRTPTERWLVLTVNRPRDEIAPQQVLPQPLAELGAAVEVRMRPAPGDRGTEIAVRQRDPGADRSGPVQRALGNSPSQQLRSALRRTKQLLETGEVLAVDPQPHGDRKPTPGSALIAAATRRAGQEGVLGKRCAGAG